MARVVRSFLSSCLLDVFAPVCFLSTEAFLRVRKSRTTASTAATTTQEDTGATEETTRINGGGSSRERSVVSTSLAGQKTSFLRRGRTRVRQEDDLELQVERYVDAQDAAGGASADRDETGGLNLDDCSRAKDNGITDLQEGANSFLSFDEQESVDARSSSNLLQEKERQLEEIVLDEKDEGPSSQSTAQSRLSSGLINVEQGGHEKSGKGRRGKATTAAKISSEMLPRKDAGAASSFLLRGKARTSGKKTARALLMKKSQLFGGRTKVESRSRPTGGTISVKQGNTRLRARAQHDQVDEEESDSDAGTSTTGEAVDEAEVRQAVEDEVVVQQPGAEPSMQEEKAGAAIGSATLQTEMNKNKKKVSNSMYSLLRAAQSPHTLYSDKGLTADEHRRFTVEQLDLVEEKVKELKKVIEESILLSDGATGCRKSRRNGASSAALSQKKDLLRTSGSLVPRFGGSCDAAGSGSTSSSPGCISLGNGWAAAGNTPSGKALAGATLAANTAVGGDFGKAAFSEGDDYFTAQRTGRTGSFFPRIQARWATDGIHYSSTGARIDGNGRIHRDELFNGGADDVDVAADLEDEKNFDDCVAAKVGRMLVGQFGSSGAQHGSSFEQIVANSLLQGGTSSAAAAAQNGVDEASAVQLPYVAYASFGLATTGRVVEWPQVDVVQRTTAPGSTSTAGAAARNELRAELRTLDARHAPWYEGSTRKRVGKNVVLAVDFSGSMRKDGKWDTVIAAVQQLLDTLSPYDRFAIFQWYQPFAHTGGANLASLELVPATRRNVNLAKNWIRERRQSGYSETSRAPGAAFTGLALASGLGIFPADARSRYPKLVAPQQDCIRDEDFCGAMVLLITDAEKTDTNGFADLADTAGLLKELFPARWGITLAAYVISPHNEVDSWSAFKQLSENHGGSPVLLDYEHGGSAAASDMATTILGYQKTAERRLMQQEKDAAGVKWVRYHDPFTGRERLSACTKLFSTGPYAEEEAALRELKHYAVFCLDAALILREPFDARLRCLPFLKTEVGTRAEQGITAACPAYDFREERCAANSRYGDGIWKTRQPKFDWRLSDFDGGDDVLFGPTVNFEYFADRTQYLQSLSNADDISGGASAVDLFGSVRMKGGFNPFEQEEGCAAAFIIVDPTSVPSTSSTTTTTTEGLLLAPIMPAPLAEDDCSFPWIMLLAFLTGLLCCAGGAMLLLPSSEQGEDVSAAAAGGGAGGLPSQHDDNPRPERDDMVSGGGFGTPVDTVLASDKTSASKDVDSYTAPPLDDVAEQQFAEEDTDFEVSDSASAMSSSAMSSSEPSSAPSALGTKRGKRKNKGKTKVAGSGKLKKAKTKGKGPAPEGASSSETADHSTPAPSDTDGATSASSLDARTRAKVQKNREDRRKIKAQEADGAASDTSGATSAGESGASDSSTGHIGAKRRRVLKRKKKWVPKKQGGTTTTLDEDGASSRKIVAANGDGADLGNLAESVEAVMFLPDGGAHEGATSRRQQAAAAGAEAQLKVPRRGTTPVPLDELKKTQIPKSPREKNKSAKMLQKAASKAKSDLPRQRKDRGRGDPGESSEQSASEREDVAGTKKKSVKPAGTTQKTKTANFFGSKKGASAGATAAPPGGGGPAGIVTPAITEAQVITGVEQTDAERLLRKVGIAKNYAKKLARRLADPEADLLDQAGGVAPSTEKSPHDARAYKNFRKKEQEAKRKNQQEFDALTEGEKQTLKKLGLAPTDTIGRMRDAVVKLKKQNKKGKLLPSPVVKAPVAAKHGRFVVRPNTVLLPSKNEVEKLLMGKIGLSKPYAKRVARRLQNPDVDTIAKPQENSNDARAMESFGFSKPDVDGDDGATASSPAERLRLWLNRAAREEKKKAKQKTPMTFAATDAAGADTTKPSSETEIPKPPDVAEATQAFISAGVAKRAARKLAEQVADAEKTGTRSIPLAQEFLKKRGGSNTSDAEDEREKQQAMQLLSALGLEKDTFTAEDAATFVRRQLKEEKRQDQLALMTLPKPVTEQALLTTGMSGTLANWLATQCADKRVDKSADLTSGKDIAAADLQLLKQMGLFGETETVGNLRCFLHQKLEQKYGVDDDTGELQIDLKKMELLNLGNAEKAFSALGFSKAGSKKLAKKAVENSDNSTSTAPATQGAPQDYYGATADHEMKLSAGMKTKSSDFDTVEDMDATDLTLMSTLTGMDTATTERTAVVAGFAKRQIALKTKRASLDLSPVKVVDVQLGNAEQVLLVQGFAPRLAKKLAKAVVKHADEQEDEFESQDDSAKDEIFGGSVTAQATMVLDKEQALTNLAETEEEKRQIEAFLRNKRTPAPARGRPDAEDTSTLLQHPGDQTDEEFLPLTTGDLLEDLRERIEEKLDEEAPAECHERLRNSRKNQQCASLAAKLAAEQGIEQPGSKLELLRSSATHENSSLGELQRELARARRGKFPGGGGPRPKQRRGLLAGMCPCFCGGAAADDDGDYASDESFEQVQETQLLQHPRSWSPTSAPQEPAAAGVSDEPPPPEGIVVVAVDPVVVQQPGAAADEDGEIKGESSTPAPATATEEQIAYVKEEDAFGAQSSLSKSAFLRFQAGAEKDQENVEPGSTSKVGVGILPSDPVIPAQEQATTPDVLTPQGFEM
ncbi:unnamed protein product [Amoebophrya sp. A120]|nr:unnamed protein product [Amoebophrya sp. A120]|eukprot:GSA120T00006214001.1